MLPHSLRPETTADHGQLAAAMLLHYDDTRTTNCKGLTIPSQRRCVQNYAAMLGAVAEGGGRGWPQRRGVSLRKVRSRPARLPGKREG
jgi:hypothetical protein